MAKRAKFALAAVMAGLLSVFFFQLALADSPDSSQCGSDIGVHKQVGDKRFSLKGVITNMNGSNITICGVVVNTSHAKVKGDLSQAMTQKFLVTAVGKVSGNTNEAQEVRVHPNGGPSGATGKNEDDKDKAKDKDEDANGGNARAEEGKGKPEGVGKGDEKKDGQPDIKSEDNKAVSGLENAEQKVEDAVQHIQAQGSLPQPVKDNLITVLERLIDSLQKLLSSLRR